MQPELVISLEGMQSNTCTAVQSVLRGEDPATLCPRPSLQAQIVAPMAKRGPPTPSQDSVRTVFSHTVEPKFIHRILPNTKLNYKKNATTLYLCSPKAGSSHRDSWARVPHNPDSSPTHSSTAMCHYTRAEGYVY